MSEAALAQGRTNLVRRILQNDQALEESLPGFIPQVLRKPLRFLATDALRRLDRKYADLVQPQALRRALEATREALAASKNDYLTGSFSYADISMATVLEVIAPIATVEPPQGPATKACWIDAELSKEFADLCQWRDRLASNPDTSYSQFSAFKGGME